MKRVVMEMVVVFKKTPTIGELATLMDDLRAFMKKNPNVQRVKKMVIGLIEEE